MKRIAFTLAEVLITLGIIGIVAAMTIPNLITEHQKRATVTKLERAISVINQAYKLSYDDVGEPNAETSATMGSKEYFSTYWAPYIKVLTYCSSPSICGYKDNKPWIGTNGSDYTMHIVYGDWRTAFLTMDGILYIILVSSGDTMTDRRVYVDINGGAKPNRYGKDVFILSRVEKDGGGIQPYGFDKSDDVIIKNCSKNGLGEYCAERIRRAGWEIDKSYPWK